MTNQIVAAEEKLNKKVSARLECNTCCFKRIVENALYILPRGYAWDNVLNEEIDEHLHKFPDHREMQVSIFRKD